MAGRIAEKVFQHKVIQRLQNEFPGCMVLKTDPGYIQGIPDLLILYKNKWASIECKRSLTALVQPNQDYWVDTLNEMSYSNFICPENEEEVFNDLQQLFIS